MDKLEHIATIDFCYLRLKILYEQGFDDGIKECVEILKKNMN